MSGSFLGFVFFKRHLTLTDEPFAKNELKVASVRFCSTITSNYKMTRKPSKSWDEETMWSNSVQQLNANTYVCIYES